jgi:hypothetical protein
MLAVAAPQASPNGGQAGFMYVCVYYRSSCILRGDERFVGSAVGENTEMVSLSEDGSAVVLGYYPTFS